MTRQESIIEYDTKPLMTSDCLKVLKCFSSDIFQTKFGRLWLWIMIAVIVSIYAITIYYMINRMNTEEILYYLYGDLALVYPLITAWFLLFCPVFDHISDEIPLWKIDSAGPKIHQKITLSIKFITIFAVADIIFTLVAAFLFILKLSDDASMFILLRFIYDYIPYQKTTLKYIWKFIFVFMANTMVVHAYQIVYYSEHIRFQTCMFKQYITHLGDSVAHGNEEKLFYDKIYQSEVRRRLIFCSKRLQDFVKVYTLKVREMGRLIVIFALCGCLLGVSIILCHLSGRLTSEYHIWYFIGCFSTAWTFSVVIWAGQSVETERELLLPAITGVSWYHFNRNNKCLYLILLTQIMQSRKIQFTENYCFNYRLGVAITKGIYSVISILVNRK